MRAFLTFRLLLVAAVGALLVLPAQAQDGPLDPSFGEGGRVVFDRESSGATDVLVQPDGKLVLAGWSEADPATDHFIARLLPDGRPDPTFGGNGLVRTWLDISAIALQEDGRIVAAGGAPGFIVARYTPSGDLDLSFNYDGYAWAPISNPFEGIFAYVTDVAVQPDGQIVVVGGRYTGPDISEFAMARFMADGRPDYAFGQFGIVLLSTGLLGRIQAVALQPDGRIVVAGWSGVPLTPGILVARFESDGSFDVSFGYNGIATTSIYQHSGANALQVLNDGRIVVAGGASSSSNRDIALVRYLPNGTLDAAFGQGGKVLTDLLEHDDALDLAVRPDGRLVVAGYGRASTLSSPHRFAVVAYTADGALDDSFVEGGVALTSFGVHKEVASAVVVQPDGRIVAAGYASDGETSATVLARYLTGTAIPTEEGPGEAALALGAPYPNPAGGVVTVPFSTAAAGPIRLTVHDVLGREVAVLAEGPRTAGAHEVMLDTAALPAGTYVLRLHAEGEVRIGRFTVVR